MTRPHDDDFDRLAAALKATPSPDADTRATHLAQARDAFEAAQAEATQAAAPQPRPTPVRQNRRSRSGGRSMLSRLTSPAVLTTTGGLLAASVALVAILPQMEPSPGLVPVSSLDGVGESKLQQAAPAPAVVPVPRDASRATREVGLSAAPQVAEAEADLSAEPLVQPSLAFDDVRGDVTGRPNTEAFAETDRAGITRVDKQPVSTFSVDVDTASWAVIRSSIQRGGLPPAQAVRIEEMVNYFTYDYPEPTGEHPFSVDVTVTETPWNADTRLLRIGLQGQRPAAARPPLNLVLLIDTSGSMNQPNKLPLLKSAVRLMLPKLTEQDEIAIVTYAGTAGTALGPTQATDRRAIEQALQSLDPSGGTAGHEGLRAAYELADQMTSGGEVSRILLATDGDFNIGPSSTDQLQDFVSRMRDTGVYLSILGFGRGNLDDAIMQTLAQNGNGTAAYIDTLQEAQKVLVDQLSGALFPIADDVKVQVEFNPAAVAEYRLLGYETRALRREDFRNDAIDAGEIGAGHQVTALYEVTAPDSPAISSEPLRYQPDALSGDSDELGFLRLRYKTPGADESIEVTTPIANTTALADLETNWAAAIAGFGQILTGSPYLGSWAYPQAISLADENRGADPFAYRSEAVQLMRLSESLSQGR